MKFLSTLSLRRATAFAVYNPPGGVISLHALLAESDDTQLTKYSTTEISIHALLAESDRTINWHQNWEIGSISIHALLAESDP